MTDLELIIEIVEEGAQENTKNDPGHEIGIIVEGTHGQPQSLKETPQAIRDGVTTQDLTQEKGKEPCLSS